MRNWTPVLKESPKGLVYCSPSCGFDCLRADYEYAVAKAAEMANELGRGFIPTVHENCQWYYGIKKGFMEINPIVDNYTDRNVTGYRAYYNLPNQQILASGDTVTAAYNNVMAETELFISSCVKDHAQIFAETYTWDKITQEQWDEVCVGLSPKAVKRIANLIAHKYNVTKINEHEVRLTRYDLDEYREYIRYYADGTCIRMKTLENGYAVEVGEAVDE